MATAGLRDYCRGRSQGLVDLKGKGPVELIECHELLVQPLEPASR
ncbi:MAG TPA: hypothetical protein VED46_12720 [Alphaproteobacteria bacterium]|nr:hypothetical protein [Alphaproteobacteria bacterium]